MELAIYPSMPRLDWLVKLYENLTYVRMRPAAIALNYSVKDIRNDVIEQTSVGLAHARPNDALVDILTTLALQKFIAKIGFLESSSLSFFTIKLVSLELPQIFSSNSCYLSCTSVA